MGQDYFDEDLDEDHFDSSQGQQSLTYEHYDSKKSLMQ